jgi:hypothetical protein
MSPAGMAGLVTGRSAHSIHCFPPRQVFRSIRFARADESDRFQPTLRLHLRKTLLSLWNPRRSGGKAWATAFYSPFVTPILRRGIEPRPMRGKNTIRYRFVAGRAAPVLFADLHSLPDR